MTENKKSSEVDRLGGTDIICVLLVAGSLWVMNLNADISECLDKMGWTNEDRNTSQYTESDFNSDRYPTVEGSFLRIA